MSLTPTDVSDNDYQSYFNKLKRQTSSFDAGKSTERALPTFQNVFAGTTTIQSDEANCKYNGQPTWDSRLACR
jgi:hypothetical protein